MGLIRTGVINGGGVWCGVEIDGLTNGGRNCIKGGGLIRVVVIKGGV